jgi:hypothetical protein
MARIFRSTENYHMMQRRDCKFDLRDENIMLD